MGVYALRIGRGASKQKLLLGVGLYIKILFVGAHPNPKPAGSLDQSARDYITMKLWHSPGQRRGAQLVFNNFVIIIIFKYLKSNQTKISMSKGIQYLSFLYFQSLSRFAIERSPDTPSPLSPTSPSRRSSTSATELPFNRPKPENFVYYHPKYI